MTIEKMAGYYPIPVEEAAILMSFSAKYPNSRCLAMMRSYAYGVIVGKRMERARRKRGK